MTHCFCVGRYIIVDFLAAQTVFFIEREKLAFLAAPATTGMESQRTGSTLT